MYIYMLYIIYIIYYIYYILYIYIIIYLYIICIYIIYIIIYIYICIYKILRRINRTTMNLLPILNIQSQCSTNNVIISGAKYTN